MTLDQFRQMLMGPGGPPTSEGQRDQDWAVRTRAPHEAAEALPAGVDAWTNYAGHDRRLTRKREHERAQRVGVIEPLGPGERVRVDEIEPGVYEARKW